MTPATAPLGDLQAATVELVRRVAASGGRFVLGIAGPPGAGKSTAAAAVVRHAAASLAAVVAPMDGFHRSNEDLALAGLLDLKGIPESFDGAGFAAHLAALRVDPPAPVAWPTYDRAAQAVVPGGTTIEPEDQLVVVEGNYLLLDAPPWHRIRPLLDEVWYLDVPIDVLHPRLLAPATAGSARKPQRRRRWRRPICRMRRSSLPRSAAPT